VYPVHWGNVHSHPLLALQLPKRRLLVEMSLGYSG
jgi:hypothetical protein